MTSVIVLAGIYFRTWIKALFSKFLQCFERDIKASVSSLCPRSHTTSYWIISQFHYFASRLDHVWKYQQNKANIEDSFQSKKDRVPCHGPFSFSLIEGEKSKLFLYTKYTCSYTIYSWYFQRHIFFSYFPKLLYVGINIQNIHTSNVLRFFQFSNYTSIWIYTNNIEILWLENFHPVQSNE